MTLRATKGLPSFRQEVLFAAFDRAFRTTRREDFRIVEFSVQANHVHLIVEASDKQALARGMKSFSVRANRLLNSAMGRRRGRIWGDRYHRQDLSSPRQIRNALVYCLNNFKKHAAGRHEMRDGRPRIDRYSSARWFDGWISHQGEDDGDRPTPLPSSFLLRVGWRRHGLLHPGEAPHHPAGASTRGRRSAPSVV